jgi:hypothetical protein
MFYSFQQAQIEAEKQRQLEWEKRKKEELLNHKSLEKDIVTGLQVRKDKMVLERENMVSISMPWSCCMLPQETSIHAWSPGMGWDLLNL